jgi:hypothetical protein
LAGRAVPPRIVKWVEKGKQKPDPKHLIDLRLN